MQGPSLLGRGPSGNLQNLASLHKPPPTAVSGRAHATGIALRHPSMHPATVGSATVRAVVVAEHMLGMRATRSTAARTVSSLHTTNSFIVQQTTTRKHIEEEDRKARPANMSHHLPKQNVKWY